MKKTLLTIIFAIFINGIYAQNTEGKTISINYDYGLKNVSYCQFYGFKIFKDTILDYPVLKELKKEYENSTFFNSKNSSENYLKINSLLSFKWDTEDIVCINYDKIFKDGKKEKIIYSSNNFLPILKNIDYILKLSNNAFWEFYNSNNNPDYPEINKLKSLAKNANGVLNIEKLAKVIKENEDFLSKYLDK